MDAPEVALEAGPRTEWIVEVVDAAADELVDDALSDAMVASTELKGCSESNETRWVDAPRVAVEADVRFERIDKVVAAAAGVPVDEVDEEAIDEGDEA